MPTFDASFWTTLAHPCVGAAIGYLTNRIAIRMLFRPLYPWRLFGLRIPLTPGVIPSQRHVLAVNIGEMVGKRLLTSADIGIAIAAPPFQDTMTAVIDREIDAVLNRELGPLPELIPSRLQAYFKLGVKALRRHLGEGVNRYLAGDAFAGRLAEAINRQLDALGNREIGSLLAEENRQALYLFLQEKLTGLLASEQAEQWLGEQLHARLWRVADQQRTLGEALPEPVIELLRQMVAAHCPDLLDKMADQLEEPRLRGQLVRGVLSGVDQFLASLGPVGAMASGFLERDVMEEKIGACLAERNDDVRAWLHQPEMQARMARMLGQGLDALLARPLAELLRGVEAERLVLACHELAARLLEALRGEEAQAGLGVLLQAAMEELFEQGSRPLGSLGRQFFSNAQRARVRDAVQEEVLGLLRSHRGQRLVGQAVSAMIDGAVRWPVGALSTLAPQGVRRGIGDQLRKGLNQILLRELPGVIDSLHIQELVTEKVNGLDLLQLEQLLLSIMQRQFKYINWFGALLGFFIGLINLALAELF